tara:strand:+ start:2584 stop:2865 length:282 start_codon:yes stop_codon:yes gene_type:complete
MINPGIFELLPTGDPNAVISATIFYENQLSSQRFMILDRLSGGVIASGKTDEQGVFTRFVGDKYVIDDALLVVGFDDTGTYNAQVADHINGVL